MSISNEFWATTAQVIPALLLTFAVMAKPSKVRTEPHEWYEVPLSVVALLSLAVGVAAEFAALEGLLTGGTPWTARVVVLGIGVLAFWLLANTSLRLGTKLFPADEDENEGCFVLIVAIFSVVVAMLPLAGAIWLAARI